LTQAVLLEDHRLSMGVANYNVASREDLLKLIKMGLLWLTDICNVPTALSYQLQSHNPLLLINKLIEDCLPNIQETQQREDFLDTIVTFMLAYTRSPAFKQKDIEQIEKKYIFEKLIVNHLLRSDSMVFYSKGLAIMAKLAFKFPKQTARIIMSYDESLYANPKE
jgi:hypothetical protein